MGKLNRKQMCAGWQSEYGAAVEQGNAPANLGDVVDVYGIVDRYGCQHLHVEFDDQALCVYHEQSLDNVDDIKEIERNGRVWANAMLGAANWHEWTWYTRESCPLC